MWCHVRPLERRLVASGLLLREELAAKFVELPAAFHEVEGLS